MCDDKQLCVENLCKDCDDGNAYDWDGCNTGDIVEFGVNMFTSGNQFDPVCAVFADGAFAALWTSYSSNSGHDILGQFYDFDGSALTMDVLVSAQTLGKQESPRVLAFPDGRLLAAWRNSYGSGDESPIMAALFNQTGIKEGADFGIETDAIVWNQHMDLVSLPPDRFLLSWAGTAPSCQAQCVPDVYARTMFDDGEEDGDEWKVNTYTQGVQYGPRIARAGDDFVVVWQSCKSSYQQPGDGQDGHRCGVFGRRLVPGTGPVEEEFQINSFTQGNQLAPVVAGFPDGRFVVAWQSCPDWADDDPGQDGDDCGVFARTFDAAGNPLTEELQANSLVEHNQDAPTLVAYPEGAFTIIWRSWGQDDSGAAVMARRFDVQEGAVSEEYQVNSFTTGDQKEPNAARLPDGGLLVIWTSESQDGGGSGVFAQRFNADGTKMYH